MREERTRYWKFISIPLGFVAALLLALTIGNIGEGGTVYASTSLTVSSVSELKSALDAAESATSDNPYVITLSAGTYTLSDTLYIPSYTTLNATGSTITQDSSYTGVMLRTGKNSTDTAAASGYCYTDITLIGGTWDKNGHDGTLIQICHAQNVIVQGVTFQNTYNGHLMEAAGVSTLAIDSCIFQNQVLDVEFDSTDAIKAYEAIQIDILQNLSSDGSGDGHLSGYATEDLTNQNISITNCSFYNVPRGIGSHTAVLNNPINTLVIQNCTFDGIESAAIQLMAVQNCTISSNTITDAARGILVYTYRDTGTFLGTSLDSSSTTSTAYAVFDSNLVISDNTVTLNSDGDAYDTWKASAISVQGIRLSTATECGGAYTGNVLEAGDYYIKGVTITGNTVYTTLRGIWLHDARDTTVSDNIIYYIGTKEKNSDAYGIYVSGASKGIDQPIEITGNSIYNSSSSYKIYRGVFISGKSTVNVVSENTIPATYEHGILLYNNSRAKTISNNTIESSGKSGIVLYMGSTSSTISGNAISSPTKYGISVDSSTSSGSKATTISSNTITSAGRHGIFVYSGGTATTIKSNEIISPKENGIHLNSGSATTISSNTIQSAGKNGIMVYNGSTATTISSNTITSPTKYGIDVDGATAKTIKNNTISSSGNNGITMTSSSSSFSASKVTTISGNTVTGSGRRSISVTSLGKALTISSNTISSGTDECIFLYPATTDYTIKVNSNTITGSSKSNIGIYATQGKVSASANTIKSCSDPIYFTTTVTGTLYTSNSMSSNTTNKFRIGSKYYSGLTKPTITIGSKKTTSLKLSWDEVSGTGYVIYRATSKDGDYSKVKTISDSSTTSWTNKDLSSGTTYYYKMRAKKKVGNTTIYSSYSSVVSGKTTSS